MFKNKETLRKADIIFGIVLIIIFGVLLHQSITMPTDTLKVANPSDLRYTAPGLLPALISGVLVILGVLLIVQAFKEGARITKEDFENFKRWLTLDESKRMWGIFAIIMLYTLVMIGRLPYVVSTFVYLFAFMWYIKAVSWWKNLVISLLTTVIIAVLFGSVVMIPLP